MSSCGRSRWSSGSSRTFPPRMSHPASDVVSHRRTLILVRRRSGDVEAFVNASSRQTPISPRVLTKVDKRVTVEPQVSRVEGSSAAYTWSPASPSKFVKGSSCNRTDR